MRAGARYQASVVPAREVGKMSAFKAVEKAQAIGALTISVHKTRAEAEAAIREWRAKHEGELSASPSAAGASRARRAWARVAGRAS